ncbi:hypothetical protein BT96DRAFT_980343 [Gymnopus androsaceus JB14]|uniref:DNA endonuclease activator Ctp1 C-terminal domain-containing protein n=1 Tax=Gymnopus androsaceus JB14 TaxID=1447944 RepID=A0A6A4GXZ5_9AGAR|nr:hypothetical protein BT96DRAFT_980343 [Gymnopus androsaceus JB14]
MENETFSSATHRQRDKIIQQKHEDEIHRFTILLDKQKYINSELRNSLFDIKNRTKTLVQTLGFPDLMGAQVYLDAQRSKGQAVDYKERFGKIEKLENELKEAKMFNQKIEARERELEEENTALRRARDESSSAYRQLAKEYKNLEEKHHDSVKAHEAASLRREKDGAQWRSFKQWILCAAEIAQFQQYDNQYGFTGREKAKELFKIVAGKKYKLSQLDTLDDEQLFSVCEQDMKEFQLPSCPAALNQAGEPPLNSSSKVNQPLEGQSILNPDSVLPPRKLVRSYAMNNTPASPVGGDPNSTHSTVVDEGRANITLVVPHSRTEDESQAVLMPPLPPSVASPKPAVAIAPDSQTEDESQAPPLPSTAGRPKPTVLAPDSETEDDSQSFRLSQLNTRPAPKSAYSTRIPLTFNPVVSSAPAGPSGSRRPLPLFDSACSPIPAKPTPASYFDADQAESSRRVEVDQYPRRLSQSRRPASPEPTYDDEPPRKYRRSSEGNRVPSVSPVDAKIVTPRQRRPSLGSRRNRSRSRARDGEREWDKENTSARINRDSDRWRSDGEREGERITDKKGKGKAAVSTTKGTLDDYLMYKGRGRYGKGKEKEKDRGAENTTINELYAIEPSRNGGLDFAYDEVVRGKEKRKRLLGADCDDCREYYRAIGPMPPRLQQPLWKSPVKDSSVSPCRRHGHGHGHQHTSAKRRIHDDDDDDASIFYTPSRGTTATTKRARDRSPTRDRRASRNDIDMHKQNISRHRAAWARGTTPPGYWDIGFPDTQMAEDINERAREMHQRKMETVEREAARGGGIEGDEKAS